MSQNLPLEDIIQKALLKINGKREIDLSRFLPCSRGYMHHFTFRKMMQENPQQLSELIKKHIIESEKPQEIQFKPIEKSHQTKKMKEFSLSQDDMDRLLHVARQAQDLELIEKLQVKQGFYPDDHPVELTSGGGASAVIRSKEIVLEISMDQSGNYSYR